jgi:hypothetical protein
MIAKIKNDLQRAKDEGWTCELTREQAAFLLGYIEGLESQRGGVVNPYATNGKPDYFYSKLSGPEQADK